MIKIAICDDSTECIKTIKTMIMPYETKYQLEIKTFESGEAFFENKDTFDILFLDIEMKQISGIDVAASIRANNDDAIIIFITSHSNYVSDSFRLRAFQYLTKPFSEKDFRFDFERALSSYNAKHKKFVVKFMDERAILECKDILYIEAYDRHLFIKTIDNQYECVGKLSDKYEELKFFGFERCHQGFLVNIKKIKRISGYKVIMETEVEVPISRKYKSTIIDAFNLYIAGETK